MTHIIASLLKNSLTNEELSHIQEKKLLSLLGEINDAELVILKYHGLNMDPARADKYIDTHEDVIRSPFVVMGSPDEDVDRHAVHETYRATLRRLGLLQTKYKKPKKGHLPEFDEKTGMMKAGSDQITRLGRLLLRYIDA